MGKSIKSSMTNWEDCVINLKKGNLVGDYLSDHHIFFRNGRELR